MTTQTERAPSKTPVHLWIVGGISLLWNAVGAMDSLMTQLKFEPYMNSFTAEQLEYFYGMPAWVDAGWARGVWAAVAGSVGLLPSGRLPNMRSRFGQYLARPRFRSFRTYFRHSSS